MPSRYAVACTLVVASRCLFSARRKQRSPNHPGRSRSRGPCSVLSPPIQKLAAADRDIGIAVGKRIQAGAIPNPELSFELDDAFGTGQYRSLVSRKRRWQSASCSSWAASGTRASPQDRPSSEARSLAARRPAAGDSLRYGGGVLQRAQRPAQDPDLRRPDRLARPPHASVAAARRCRRFLAGRDRARASRRRSRARRARTRTHDAGHRAARACDPHGFQRVDFAYVVGDLNRIGKPPPFQAVLRGMDGHPQLDPLDRDPGAEGRGAPLRASQADSRPEDRAGLEAHPGDDRRGHRRDNAVKSAPDPDPGLGSKSRRRSPRRREARAKVEAERAAARRRSSSRWPGLMTRWRERRARSKSCGRSALPNAQTAVDGIESGYSQGRFTLLEAPRRPEHGDPSRAARARSVGRASTPRSRPSRA